MLEFASIDEFCNTTFDPSFVSLSRMLDAMALLIPHLKCNCVQVMKRPGVIIRPLEFEEVNPQGKVEDHKQSGKKQKQKKRNKSNKSKSGSDRIVTKMKELEEKTDRAGMLNLCVLVEIQLP
ncbi:uncharacterized protein LOC126627742 [Malus sylvestris]|uniref:uncharacterized protein LOC126627742 n=1 Tax=Malus sylvestris TaxID=3752 RepID=UPI0021AC5560|nr:uncharacterized protein LOC126627742 [Malus sylvestris]